MERGTRVSSFKLPFSKKINSQNEKNAIYNFQKTRLCFYFAGTRRELISIIIMVRNIASTCCSVVFSVVAMFGLFD